MRRVPATTLNYVGMYLGSSPLYSSITTAGTSMLSSIHIDSYSVGVVGGEAGFGAEMDSQKDGKNMPLRRQSKNGIFCL